MARTYLALITPSVSNPVPIGVWQDISMPEYTISANGGWGGLTLDVPRKYGRMDEPNEPVTTGTLAHGNMVVIVATDFWTESSIYDAIGRGKRIFAGTIESWKADLVKPNVRIQIVPVDRILRTALLSVGLTDQWVATDFVTGIKNIIDDQATMFTWHPNNPTTCGYVNSKAFGVRIDSIADVLDWGVDFGGAGYIWYVDPDMNIRFFQQDVEGASTVKVAPPTDIRTHDLTVGYHLVGCEIEKIGSGRYNKVTVIWTIDPPGSTSYHVKEAADFDGADPRWAVVDKRDTIVSSTNTQADEYADTFLAAASRLAKRIRIAVSNDLYNTAEMRIGDLVRVWAERELGTGTNYAGYEDVIGVPYLIASITMRHDRCEVELEKARPRVETKIRTIDRRLAALENA